MNREAGGPPLRAGAWGMLLVLAAVQFTHLVDFVILMPLGPRYQRELKIGPDEFGKLVSAYAFAASISGLLAGLYVDRFDRKRALLVYYAGFAGGTLLCALAADYWTLLVARAVAGAFGGVLGALSLAIVGDVFPEERRGLATGVVMAAFSVASTVGVPAGLLAAEAWGTSTPFAILVGVSVGVFCLAAWLLPSLRGHVRAGPARRTPWEVLVRRRHVRAYLLMTCLVLSVFTLVPYLPTYLVANAGWSTTSLATMYLCGGVTTLVTTPLVGRVADLHGKRPVFRVLALATMVPIVLVTSLGPAPLAWWLALTTLFMVMTSGRMVPAMALINSSVEPAYRGSIMSVVASVQQMVAGLASLVGGMLVRQPQPNGPLEGYWRVGVLGCVASVVAVVLVGQVHPAPAEVVSCRSGSA